MTTSKWLRHIARAIARVLSKFELFNDIHYRRPLDNFSVEVPDGYTTVILDPARPLDRGIVIFPSRPFDRQALTIVSSAPIRHLTVTTPWASLCGSPECEYSVTYSYRAANRTWYCV
jgi:hypothetical protein